MSEAIAPSLVGILWPGPCGTSYVCDKMSVRVGLFINCFRSFRSVVTCGPTARRRYRVSWRGSTPRNTDVRPAGCNTKCKVSQFPPKSHVEVTMRTELRLCHPMNPKLFQFVMDASRGACHWCYRAATPSVRRVSFGRCAIYRSLARDASSKAPWTASR